MTTIRILEGENNAAIYDSVTERVFGPLFENAEDAQSFLDLHDDLEQGRKTAKTAPRPFLLGVRLFPWTADSEALYDEWLAQRSPS